MRTLYYTLALFRDDASAYAVLNWRAHALFSIVASSELVPHAELWSVAEAGHVLPIERSAETGQRLLSWWQTLTLEESDR